MGRARGGAGKRDGRGWWCCWECGKQANHWSARLSKWRDLPCAIGKRRGSCLCIWVRSYYMWTHYYCSRPAIWAVLSYGRCPPTLPNCLAATRTREQSLRHCRLRTHSCRSSVRSPLDPNGYIRICLRSQCYPPRFYNHLSLPLSLYYYYIITIP